jgi:hypothetical protein
MSPGMEPASVPHGGYRRPLFYQITTTMTQPDPTAIPAASFLNFLSGLATQGMIQVGAVPHPVTGERAVQVPYARYTVQLLEVLKDKTEGRRTDEEDKYLKGAIADLKHRVEQLTAAD